MPLDNPASESFVNNLLSQMTVDEKIGQLHQYFNFKDFDSDLIRQGRAGSVINAAGALGGQGQSASTSADVCNHIQRLAQESRLKIPQLFGRDVIHGYRTVFPINLGQAAAWNPALAEQAAAVAAREASADGIKWTFAPMLDIARDARWGRIAEGAGEDPLLGAAMARAIVRGFQGDDFAQPDRLVACAKHYVGYGTAEGGRDYEGGELSEAALRDVYLPPFQAAVEAGAGTLMSAFLDLNGVPATANRKLLTDVLRGEWGFKGFVVSDWASVLELIQHGIAEDDAQAAAIALHAGVDMDMVSGAYLNTLAASLQAGRVTREEIDEAARRVLRVKHLAGLFEDPFTDPARAARDILRPDARALARRFARESMVLLKNEHGLLPLEERFKRVAVVGPLVNAQAELLGTWAPDGRPEDVTPPSDGLQQAVPQGVSLKFAEHADQAVLAAMSADVVVLVVGEHPSRSGENANVADLGLPPGQAELVDAVVAQGKPVVLVVLAGRPLAITRQAAQASAVLYAWHPGLEGGSALGEVLFGWAADGEAASPSGRLPVSLPRATGQAPIYYNHKNSGRPLGPSQVSGHFLSRYVDAPSTPLFPFGHGLAYTHFEYGDSHSSGDMLRGSVQISAQVTNTGPRVGVAVAQLYVRDLVGSLTRPVRELKGFQRLSLAPGESQRVSFLIKEEDLAFTRADGTRGVEPGQFQAWIAPDSSAGSPVEFRL
jgi:beta-glucosidase